MKPKTFFSFLTLLSVIVAVAYFTFIHTWSAEDRLLKENVDAFADDPIWWEEEEGEVDVTVPCAALKKSNCTFRIYDSEGNYVTTSTWKNYVKD